MTGSELIAGRLSGRPFQRDDWPLIAALHLDVRSAEWLLGPGDEPSEGRARRIAESFAESWLSEGFGPYLWRLRGRPVGYAGLRRSRLEGLPEIEAVWAFDPTHWGRGYATLAAAAALKADGPKPGEGLSVASWTRPHNAASLKVMEKLGFAFEREANWAGLAHLVYRWRPEEPA